ncbi:MAG TPA: amino acid adenylation domain-containing protein, partial [Flavitalea sp.]|nr:amino acid adenylation domain-containing protein [Flavitalea sp.]
QEQAASAPRNLALAFQNKVLNYNELNERANQLANYLRRRGVSEETLVPVCIERSTEMIVAILAILKAGGAYVPIDPDYPLERIKYILHDTKGKLLICSSETASLLMDQTGAEIIVADPANFAGEATDNLDTLTPPDHLAYIIYTSGSTGKPKGVMIEHGSLVNYLVNNRTRYIDTNTLHSGSFIHLSYTFDASLTGMFMPLISGKSVIIGSKQSIDVFDDENLVKYAPYDFIKITPSHLQLLQPTIKGRNKGWLTKKLVIGGEALHLSQLDDLINQEVDVEVINEYGPTEATVGCSTYSFHTLSDNGVERNEIPIGKPIDNVQLYILDDDHQLVPVGVIGEICIGGLGVARGYLNRADQSAEKFIPNPFGNDQTERLYKTGDLARWMPDGNIEYLGRKDDQVKIRGYRIELGEVESTLNELAAVNMSCVVAKREGEDHKLISYYVPQIGAVKSKERELYLNRVASWKELYEAEYGQTEEDANVDPEFNIVGWNDSFSGGSIPAEQMKEWLHDIVRLIMQNEPGSVLEIGCGTGLIYYQLAGRVKKYIGADLSRSSIKQILNHISKEKREYGITELQTAPAHEVTLPENEKVDTIILNSMVQYFPGEEYLDDVIRKSISLLNEKGRIIIGDVRDNRLLRLFKARLQTEKLQDSVGLKELKWAVDQEVLKEEELCISPEYFYRLQSLYPQIKHVDIQLKQGASVNELTLYRYNVILYIGGNAEIEKPNWQNWNGSATCEDVLKKFRQRSAAVALKHVPNFRLWKERLLSQIFDNDTAINVGELKQLIENLDNETQEVLDLLKAAMENEYSYRLLLDQDPLRVNILFEQGGQSNGFIEQPYYDGGIPGTNDVTNIPLFSDISLVLQQEIRSLLKQRIPEYMVPQDFIALDILPLTNNGKIDRLFLSQREERAVANKLNYESPGTDVEQKLVLIWQELLGLERIGVLDNFFELGGHSLLAMRVISAIRKEMGVELAIKELFHLTTIRALGMYIEIQTKTFSEAATSSEYELINI